MSKRVHWLFISVALSLAAAALLFPFLAYGNAAGEQPAPVIAGGHKIDQGLAAAMEDGQPDTALRYILFFEDKANLAPDSLPQREAMRRREIVSRLQATADQSQASVLALLEEYKAQGEVSTFRQLWIVNGIAVSGTAEAARALATHPAVARLQLDETRYHFDDFYAEDNIAREQRIGGRPWGVEQIQANIVWSGLGIRGAGSTVAIVDSGVDLAHPDLLASYRGYQENGQLAHEKHWFPAGVVTRTEPYDAYGHGTHVAGIAVGQNGIGVAPGAKWIAAAIADQYGVIYDSYVHAAFQWLLAPGGDSNAAPDVANNSWGGPSEQVKFLEDIKILHQAGIITVFSAGNGGPAKGSIQSPGSYPQTIAVGASDQMDQPAWFSSRGPSPFTDEVKPLLLAPGTQILSALPGNAYGPLNGTSMAAPHVSGAIALLLSADPGLTLAQVREVLGNSAAPVAANHPNDSSGWGRLDAYSAVISLLPHGRLLGSVSQGSDPAAEVLISVSGADGFKITGRSDSRGQYTFSLPPGTYDILYSAFGLQEKRIRGVTIKNGENSVVDQSLLQQPRGQISGIVSNSSGQSLRAQVQIMDTEQEVKTGADGQFSFSLPTGSYELAAQATGHRSRRLPVSVATDKETVINLALEDGPAILLVDSGPVRYDSTRSFYQEALLDAGFSSDLWTFDGPGASLPPQEKMAAYDIVVWSAPSNSPGDVGANGDLAAYLKAGGTLLISGRDVARLDGSPGLEQSWFRHYLQGRFSGEIETAETKGPIVGLENSLFAGLELRLNGENSAVNQIRPDVMAAQRDSFTKPVLQYAGGGAAGLEAGYCTPYRIVQLGFGLEGINGAESRRALLEQSIATLQTPRVRSGVRWQPDLREEIALPGEETRYELTVQNLSEVLTDTFDLQIEAHPWSMTLVTKTLEIGPCGVGTTLLAVEVPADAKLDQATTLRVTAVSRNDRQSRATFTMKQKTPGEILLVDDDRFFEREDDYKAALDALGYRYDVWDTTPNNKERGGPAANLLKAYSTVLWFTGYDWFAPIRPAENMALTTYLAGGGKLFLSSQDYLYYNLNTPLTRDHFGVLDYQELVTPTAVFADPDLALPGNLAGPLSLNYAPYQNFSDGIIPQANSVPFMWQDTGMTGAVAHMGVAGGRAVFWSLPLETLPEQERVTALEGVMGWLSDVGDSTFEADARYAQAGETRAYTLTLRNLPQAPAASLAISNTLPQGMSILPGSLDPDVQINVSERTLNWRGQLAPGAERQISYQVKTAGNLPAGTRLDNKVRIVNLHDQSVWRKALPLWINSPNLSRSTLSSQATNGLPERTISYTLILRNNALSAAQAVTATLFLPDSLHVLTDSLRASGGEANLTDQDVLWRGALAGRERVTTTVVVTQAVLSEAWLPAGAIIEDGLVDPIILHDRRYSPPAQRLLPIIAGP